MMLIQAVQREMILYDPIFLDCSPFPKLMHIGLCVYFCEDGTKSGRMHTRLLDFITDYSWFSQCGFWFVSLVVAFCFCSKRFLIQVGRRS